MIGSLRKKIERFLIQVNSNSNEELFDSFYNKRHWTGESASGPGSSMDATKNFRAALIEFIKSHNVRTIFDVPCGDFHWMRHVTAQFKGKYIGADISSVIIEENRKYKNLNHEFRVFNLIEEVPPDVDLIICRDLFIHLPKSDIKKCLRNLFLSGARYAMVSNYPEVRYNKEIDTGGFRPVNLCIKPFNLNSTDMKVIAVENDSGQRREIVLIEPHPNLGDLR